MRPLTTRSRPFPPASTFNIFIVSFSVVIQVLNLKFEILIELIRSLLLTAQRNCINRGVQDWASFRNFTLGVVTSSDHVQWMFIGYTADNALWLLATILLIVGNNSVLIS